MSWVDHLYDNVDKMIVAVGAAMSVYVVRTFIHDKKRLSKLEERVESHMENEDKILKEMKADIIRLESSLVTCNLDVSTKIAALQTIVISMDKKIDQIPKR